MTKAEHQAAAAAGLGGPTAGGCLRSGGLQHGGRELVLDAAMDIDIEVLTPGARSTAALPDSQGRTLSSDHGNKALAESKQSITTGAEIGTASSGK